MEKSFYFIAIIPPSDIYEIIKGHQKTMSEKFESHKSFNHIPHITLVPPFQIESNLEKKLISVLKNYSTEKDEFDIIFNGFSYFKKHTIFIDVKKSPELEKLHNELFTLLNVQPDYFKKPLSYFQKYIPHITIGYRDLEPNFTAAWNYFGKQEITDSFQFEKISLLKHTGEKWEILREFILS